jgi:rod shape-determining protein MreD
MNSTLLVNIFRFVILLALQILVFNKMNFGGYANAFPYILFIILYPVNGNKANLVIASFFLGLIMDLFCNSGGVHATACIVLAYLRPSFFKFSFGLSYEYQTVKLNDVLTPERFTFIFLAVITHNIILFLLEFFDVTFILDILIRTLLSTIYTILVCIILIYLIKPNKR